MTDTIGPKYWTGRPWNPVVGCMSDQPCWGLCWARAFHNRWHLSKKTPPKGQWIKPFDQIQEFPDRLKKVPSGKDKWVFVGNNTDIFCKGVDPMFVDQILFTLTQNPQHQYLLLTKRPERMMELVNEFVERQGEGPLPAHIWCGNSYMDQKAVDDGWEYLVRTRSMRRWISFEPLMGRIDAVPIADWVVVGCQHGANGKTFKNDWAEDIVVDRHDCHLPVFVKQLVDKNGKFTTDINKFPDDLKTRDLPWRVGWRHGLGDS